MPESVTVRGLPGALSVILSVPLRATAAVGAKRTLMVQLPPGGGEPQLTPGVKLPPVKSGLGAALIGLGYAYRRFGFDKGPRKGS